MAGYLAAQKVLVAQYDAKTAESDDLAAKIAVLVAQAKAVAAELDQNEKDKADLSSKLLGFKFKIDTLNNKIKIQNDFLVELQGKIQTTLAQIDSSNAKI